MLADAGSIPADSTTGLKTKPRQAMPGGALFLILLLARAGIETASGTDVGASRGIRPACGAPAKRVALASATLSDSADLKIAFGDFAVASSIKKSPKAIFSSLH